MSKQRLTFFTNFGATSLEEGVVRHPPELPEQEQFEALATGGITAFEIFFKTYYQPLCNYPYSFLQHRTHSEEIVHATFLSVWEKRESLTIKISPKSYLYALVRNACMNVIRHEKIKKRHLGEGLET
jgi:RNA polymerase sigma-70 factor (ECF subfamily)